MKFKSPVSRTAVRSWLVRLATENLGLKLMSLCLSIATWAWLQSEQVVERRARARVQYNFPAELARVEEVPKSVSVTVSGPQGRVRALEKRRLILNVDLSNADEGPVQIDFREQALTGLPDGLRVVQFTPPLVDISLDRLARRQVRVKPNVIGEVAEGWLLGAIKVDPPIVEIEGAQSLLRGITEVSTDIIDISAAHEDRVAEVGLIFNPRTVQATTDGTFKVEVEVFPEITDRTFPEVPVLARAPGWISTTTRALVRVEGPKKSVGRLRDNKVNITLDLPPAVPFDESVTVTWDPKVEGPVQISHGGAADEVTVVDMVPRTFVLTPAGPAPDEMDDEL